jgi:hypothetical protein
MRWSVEILNIPENTRLLRDVLEELSIEIIEDQNICFLAGQEFEKLESAAAVHKLALRVQSIVEETVIFAPELNLGMGFKENTALQP